MYQQFISDLNDNNIKVKYSNDLLASLALTYNDYKALQQAEKIAKVTTKGLKMTKNVIAGASLALANPLVFVGVCGVLVLVENILDYEEVIAKEANIATIDIKSLEDAENWIELEYAMDDVIKNSRDKNPNIKNLTIYFKL